MGSYAASEFVDEYAHPIRMAFETANRDGPDLDQIAYVIAPQNDEVIHNVIVSTWELARTKNDMALSTLLEIIEYDEHEFEEAFTSMLERMAPDVDIDGFNPTFYRAGEDQVGRNFAPSGSTLGDGVLEKYREDGPVGGLGTYLKEGHQNN